MGFLVFVVLFWSLAYSVEKAKKEWRHNRDAHARDISRAHPGWHPQKIRRHARRRAVTWWAREAAEGFPVIRHAWAEDRDHVKYLRETDRIGRETRLHELRAELGAIRRGRDEHAAATAAVKTTLPFGPWYQQHAARIRQAGTATAADTAQPHAGTPMPPGMPGPAETGGTATVGTAVTSPVRPFIATPTRQELIRQLAAAAASPDPATWLNPGAGQPGTDEAAPGAAAQAAEDFHAAIAEGRHADAAAAHQRYRAAVDAELTAAGLPPAAAQARNGTGGPAAQPAAAADGGASQAPGQQAGEPNRSNDNGGNGMPTTTTTNTTVPNGELSGDSPYRAAFTALEGYDQVAQQHEQAAETLEAQLTMHGFDRDPQLMEHIRGLRETAGQIRLHTTQARQVLTDHHAAGDEYHRTGMDAEATAFRS